MKVSQHRDDACEVAHQAIWTDVQGTLLVRCQKALCLPPCSQAEPLNGPVDAGLPRSQPPSKFLRLPRPKPLLRVAGNQLRARFGEFEHCIVQGAPVDRWGVAIEPMADDN